MSIKYDPNFKQEAINLTLSSDLGVKYKNQCNWIQQTMNKSANQAIKSNEKTDYQAL